jgi:hypothetical protein
MESLLKQNNQGLIKYLNMYLDDSILLEKS